MKTKKNIRDSCFFFLQKDILLRLYRGFMFYLCYLYLFTYTGAQHDFHVRWCSCCLAVTWQVSLVERELLALPEHMNSPSGVSGIRVARSWTLCVVFCRSLFVLFILVIVFSPFSIYGIWLPLWYLQPFLRISLVIYKNLQLECILHYWRRILPSISLLLICVTFSELKSFYWWLFLDYQALHLLLTSLATRYCP